MPTSTHNNDYDYLIIGQGLAGIWLSYFLIKMDKKVLLVDQFNPNAASNVASGIINPITGRKLVKSWQIEQLLPFARQHYKILEQLLQATFWYDREVVWRLHDNRTLNDFMGRSATSGYEQYIADIGKNGHIAGINDAYAYGKVTQAAYLDTALLVKKYRAWLVEKGCLLDAFFDRDSLIVKKEGIEWKGRRAKKIIFCEGYHVLQNPYFNQLPFRPAKGEVLIIRSEALDLGNLMIKDKFFILPWGKKHHFWVGSSYIKAPCDEVTTDGEYQKLTEHIDRLLTVPYTIVKHIAGVRPATAARRPIIGLHPHYPSIGLFNGLGTKGVSLSPFFAHQFAQYLEQGGTLHKEVAITRYAKLFENI